MSAQGPIIQTINLTKRYGKLVALSGLHLNIEQGECFGYIGPNGAGKTTTIRILATLLQPTWGEAKICGHTVGYESRLIRPLIGYVPDYFGAMKTWSFRNTDFSPPPMTSMATSTASGQRRPQRPTCPTSATQLDFRACSNGSQSPVLLHDEGPATGRAVERSRSACPYRNARLLKEPASG
jgi:hypothetical protein